MNPKLKWHNAVTLTYSLSIRNFEVKNLTVLNDEQTMTTNLM